MMNFIRKLSLFSRISFGTSILLFVYGFLCRLIPINFFWDSKYLFYPVFMMGCISLMLAYIKTKKHDDKSVTGEWVVIVFLGIGIILQLTYTIFVSQTEAYATARREVFNNHDLHEHTGKINGLGLMPIGGISYESHNGSSVYSSWITFIVNGSKKTEEVTVYMVNDPDKNHWRVEAVEIDNALANYFWLNL